MSTNQTKDELRVSAVSIAYKLVPLPSGCSNCWGDLHEGCSDECRQSSEKHSKKIDEAVRLITELTASHIVKELKNVLYLAHQSPNFRQDVLNRINDLGGETTILGEALSNRSEDNG